MKGLFRYLLVVTFITISFNSYSLENKERLSSIYEQLSGVSKPEFALFERAFLGYIDLKLSGLLSTEKNILSIIDFRIPSRKKRLWVIDLKSKVVLHHTYVAHGKNSGDQDYALDFSDDVGSLQSSLGFYVTGNTYQGKNGLSLKLNGLERGFNSNSLERYVVLHGAHYATEKYLKKHGKLGNSEGCPAVPMGLHIPIIELTKEGTCLFIYFPDAKYIETSSYILDNL